MVKKSEAKTSNEGDAIGAVLNRRLRAALAKHSRLVSAAIIVAMVIPIVAVGAQVSPQKRTLPTAPNFRANDVETGGLIRLSDYLGKVVFIDFMATWCVTCKASMPELEQLNSKYFSTISFVMISITTSVSDNISLMKQFKSEYQANWTFVVPLPFAMYGIERDYGVNAYPTYVIVDREGQIAYRTVGLTPLQTLISRIDQTLEI